MEDKTDSFEFDSDLFQFIKNINLVKTKRNISRDVWTITKACRFGKIMLKTFNWDDSLVLW